MMNADSSIILIFLQNEAPHAAFANYLIARRNDLQRGIVKIRRNPTVNAQRL